MLTLKKKIVSYICIIAMVCTMIPFSAIEVKASDKIMGTKIEVNETYIDKLSTAAEVDWFTVEIKDSGYFQLQMKPGTGDVNLGWKVCVYNYEQQCIKIETVKEEFESCEYPFAPGIYYIKIQGNGDGSSWYDPVEVPYTLQIKSVQSNFWESENNEKPAAYAEAYVDVCGNWKEEYGFEAESLDAYIPDELRNSDTQMGYLTLFPSERSDGFFIARLKAPESKKQNIQ